MLRVHSENFDQLITPQGDCKAIIYQSNGYIDFHSPIVQQLKKDATSQDLPAFTISKRDGRYMVAPENPQARSFMRGNFSTMTKGQLDDFLYRVERDQKLFQDNGVSHEKQ